jgi:small subunit ribosomal protein S16
MAVVIRLRREGTKDRPFYRIVAADERFRRDGRFLEILGTYDPVARKDALNVSVEKVDAWISKGARATETVASLVKGARKAAAVAK